MSQINIKSISGITSITTPAGVDNQLTLHTNNTNQAFKLDHAGNLHFNNHVNTTGISSASNFKTGTTDLHSLGLTAASADIDDFVSVGSNIHLGNAGIITATTFVGNLTGNPTGTLQTAAQPNITSVGTLSALTVSGNINVTSSDPTIVFVDSDNNPDFDIKAGGGRFAIRDSTNNAERIRITSAGKVGIGTDSIGATLTVQSDSSNTSLTGHNYLASQSGIILQNRTSSSGHFTAYTGNVVSSGGYTQSGSLAFEATGSGTTPNIHITQRTGSGVQSKRLTINTSGNIGIDGQSSPQAKLHIGNYETTQNENQSSVTQYFIDSTRSLKIARCNRGSVSNAGWYDVAVLSDGGFTYRCQVSIGGNFTKDIVDIEIQMAYGTTLGNKYSMQIHAKSACAHSNDRIIKVRVAEKSSVFYLQVYLQNVNSQVNGKSVLESTCGIYAQNGADNAYPMFAAASGTYSNICTTFPDFGVHASWDITVNSSHVRSYTALTGGGQEYITAENAGNGSSHGTVGRFTAPMRGLYQVNLNAKAILTPNKNQNILLTMYGSMTYDAQNVWTTNAEIYDVRGATTGAQGQQGEGNSWYLRMAAYDYFSIDWYRPAATGYTNGGGDIFNISVLKMG